MSGDGARVAYPLFQEKDGGSNPTSPLQLQIYEIHYLRAKILNKLWHSRLPIFETGAAPRFKVNYGAFYNNKCFAVAIWGMPIAPSLPLHEWLELKRMAIASDAPKYTASRMISIMTKLIRKKFPYIKKLISYQDKDVHSGTIYKASGWYEGFYHKGSDKPINYSRNKHSDDNLNNTVSSPKIRWEKDLR